MKYHWMTALSWVVVLLGLALSWAAGAWAQGPAMQTVEIVPGQTLVVRVGGYPVEWRATGVATDVALPTVYSDAPVAKAILYSLADGSLLGIMQFDVPR